MMNTFITALNILGIASIVIAIFFFINFSIKNLIFYTVNNTRNEISEEIQWSMPAIIVCILIAIFTFIVGDKFAVKDFEKKLKHNKIILLEVNGTYLNQNEVNDIFTKFIDTEGRFRCERFNGRITLENNISIPIEVVKHCYEENRYVIISKNYAIDGVIGDVKTDKFNFIAE